VAHFRFGRFNALCVGKAAGGRRRNRHRLLRRGHRDGWRFVVSLLGLLARGASPCLTRWYTLDLVEFELRKSYREYVAGPQVLPIYGPSIHVRPAAASQVDDHGDRLVADRVEDQEAMEPRDQGIVEAQTRGPASPQHGNYPRLQGPRVASPLPGNEMQTWMAVPCHIAGQDGCWTGALIGELDRERPDRENVAWTQDAFAHRFAVDLCPAAATGIDQEHSADPAGWCQQAVDAGHVRMGKDNVVERGTTYRGGPAARDGEQ